MTFFFILHIFICVLLVAVILFQDGKTGGLTSVADSSSSVFGAQGANNFLTKLTTVFAVLFMISTLFIAWNNTPNNKSIASDYAPTSTQSSDKTAVTETTGKPNPAVPSTAPAPSEPGAATVKVVDEKGNVVTQPLASQVKEAVIVKDQDQLPEEFRKKPAQPETAPKKDQ